MDTDPPNEPRPIKSLNPSPPAGLTIDTFHSPHADDFLRSLHVRGGRLRRRTETGCPAGRGEVTGYRHHAPSGQRPPGGGSQLPVLLTG